MATLILYPKSKIESGFVSELEAVTKPEYLPLRHLEARHLSSDDLNKIRDAKVIVISSWYALNVYKERLQKLINPVDICVLSRKMAVNLRQHLSENSRVNIRYANEENQQGLTALCRTYHPSESVVWLIGNLTNFKRRLSANESTLIVYVNRWSAEDQKRAEAIIATDHFESVLVTSPSAYSRLKTLIATAPQSFKNARYYTLGQKTASVIRKDTANVWMPATRNAVLARAVNQIIQDTQQTQK